MNPNNPKRHESRLMAWNLLFEIRE
jgi:hypothetical protein